MEKALPKHIGDLPSPCLLVNEKQTKINAEAMIQRCKELGLKLRPHMKTSKCLEAGKLMTGGSKRCVVVSTLAEAEYFAAGGFDDITLALLFTAHKLSRIRVLAQSVDNLHVILERKEAHTLLEENPLDDKKWSVYLFVDTGDKREGCEWDAPDTITLAKELWNSPNIDFRGLYTHEGHSYSAQGRAQIERIADSTTERLLYIAKELQAQGVDCPELGLGSTPTASHPGHSVVQLTEMHPGNYIFYDLMQREIGSCTTQDIAIRVATRVIGQYTHRRQLLIDAGWTALSKQGPLPNGSYVEVDGAPELRLVDMNQELGIVQVDGDVDVVNKYPVGTMLFLYPYHACATAAMHTVYYVHNGEDIVDVWRPCSGW